MNWRIAIIPLLLVLVAALGAGCAGTGPGTTPTPSHPVMSMPADHDGDPARDSNTRLS